MNSELSQNVGASLEGWYADHWSWRWIDWQYCVALPLMFACILYGVPQEKTNRALLSDLDWPGLAYAGLGFCLLYAGLDQGNRLDWTGSGLVDGLLISGALVTTAFVMRELVAAKPFLNVRVMARRSLLLLMLLLAGFRFIILSTAYIIPTYLQTVQNFRELQVGSVLLWIALPQLIIVLPLGALLQRVDGRWVLGFGATLIGIACLMGTDLTSAWATDDFLAIANSPGARPVLRPDGPARSHRRHDQSGGRADDRRALADEPVVRGRGRYGVHADFRAHARADPFQSDRPARG